MLLVYIVTTFCIALIAFAYVHTRQNRQFSIWLKRFDQDTTSRLNQFAWSRTVQLLMVLCGSFVATLLFYQLTLNTSQSEPVAYQAIQKKIEAIEATQVKILANLEQQHLMQASTKEQPGTPLIPGDRIANVGVSAQAVPAAPVALSTDGDMSATARNTLMVDESIASQVEQQAQAVTLQDIYNPEERNNDEQAIMDAIKKRYEGLLVNYLFLKKCNLIEDSDYHTIISTLAREMASVNAPGRLENDITTAAQGSYEEMYAQSNCDGPETRQLHTQYSDYIKTISGHIPAIHAQ